MFQYSVAVTIDGNTQVRTFPTLSDAQSHKKIVVENLERNCWVYSFGIDAYVHFASNITCSVRLRRSAAF